MYYMVGAAGTIISEKLPQYNITQITTGGSTENAKRIIKGELDMGIVYGAHVFMSQKPEGPFKNGAKGTMFRSIAKAYKGPTYFVTLPGSGIKTLADLKGKKVALGSARRARAPCSTARTSRARRAFSAVSSPA
jgi:TRAP transporter TAXI family solute receptor